jgi:hypothetical protein
MATRKAATPAPKLATETELVSRFGITAKQLRSTRLTPISDARRARIVGVRPGDLTMVATPLALSPAKPIKGKSSLTLFTAMMVDPTWPAGSGQALFSSAFPGAVFAGAQVAFMRVKKGKQHLVEFYVSLNMNVAYRFRVFTFPLGDFQDVTIQGPKPSTVITALAPPIDEISGALELGALLQHRNEQIDNAGWSLQSVQVNVLA